MKFVCLGGKKLQLLLRTENDTKACKTNAQHAENLIKFYGYRHLKSAFGSTILHHKSAILN